MSKSVSQAGRAAANSDGSWLPRRRRFTGLGVGGHRPGRNRARVQFVRTDRQANVPLTSVALP